MARERLVRAYPRGTDRDILDEDTRELALKGWSVAARSSAQGSTTVIYSRDGHGDVAPVLSPLPTALQPLPPELRRYTLNQVRVLVIGYVLALTVWLAGGYAPFTWIALLIFIATSLFALRLDSFGVASLRGQIPWLKLDDAAKWLVAIGEVIVSPIFMPYYAARVVWQFVLRQNFSSPQRVAQLEARLGMTPPTVGTCRKCGKPLQVGAEFCSYCGETVIEYPRICPNCATVCLPDAEFCPKCRTRLTA